jgi:hypothetical protein
MPIPSLIRKELHMKTAAVLSAVFSIGSISGCNSSVNASSSASTSSTSSSSSSDSSAGSHSEIAFTGNSGVHRVNGDVIEARDGVLTVNGVSYGKVTDQSVIKYSVRGDKKTVYVDGAVRKPVR